mgnify:CR=1 FL=1
MLGKLDEHNAIEVHDRAFQLTYFPRLSTGPLFVEATERNLAILFRNAPAPGFPQPSVFHGPRYLSLSLHENTVIWPKVPAMEEEGFRYKFTKE